MQHSATDTEQVQAQGRIHEAGIAEGSTSNDIEVGHDYMGPVQGDLEQEQLPLVQDRAAEK
jgi:hypothetical protein